ncbi:MAG TPA: hypothetical protein VL282_08795 [Tepidisphaeraceae bacterium]|nr:hypothetical protein [Tepidisphaeraceae bacterium]
MQRDRFRRWRIAHPVLYVFFIGIGIRLIGLLLIVVGDGHTSLLSKVVVIIGVALSIFGIGLLKWLSFQPRRKKPLPDAGP